MSAEKDTRTRRRRLLLLLVCGGAAAVLALPFEDDAASRATPPPGLRPGDHAAVTPRSVATAPRETPKTAAAPAGSTTAAPSADLPSDPGDGSGVGFVPDSRSRELFAMDGGDADLAPTMSLTDGRPGSASAMTLRVTNTSRVALRLSLARPALADRRGPLGGRLSGRLALSIDSSDGQRVYAGAPVGFAGADLGSLPPGASERWRIVLRFPDGGRPAGPAAGDNAFQGSTLRIVYVLRAVTS